MKECTLVTGGCGAIGSNLVRGLLAAGREVIVIDNLSSGSADFIPKEVKLFKNDIRDTEILERIFQDCRVKSVFHLAANFANQNSVDNPILDLEVNGLATLGLLKLALKYEVERFVYTSSSCVYGSNIEDMTEDKTGHLDTPYAISKLVGEQYVRFYAEHYGMKALSVRLFNSYGPGELGGKYRNVIPNFFQRALEKQPLVITGTGQETRDFTFVEDTIRGLLAVESHPVAEGQVYNFGTGKETPILTIAETINRLCNNPAGIRFEPRRKWDNVVRRKANIEKAKRELQWEPTTPLEKGLAKYFEWYAPLVERPR